jgi:hypothetical protein
MIGVGYSVDNRTIEQSCNCVILDSINHGVTRFSRPPALSPSPPPSS